MKELVDLLDENGVKIGTIDKDEAHKTGAWHKSVHVWIINDNNEILLQQRSPNKDFFPNIWDVSFAGHVGAGETSITAGKREGLEELGINIDESKLKFLFTNKEPLVYENIKSNEFVDVYLLRQNINLENIIFQKSEVADAKYVHISKFIDMIDKKDSTLFPHVREYELLKEELL